MTVGADGLIHNNGVEKLSQRGLTDRNLIEKMVTCNTEKASYAPQKVSEVHSLSDTLCSKSSI